MLQVDKRVKIKANLHADTKYSDIYCHAGMLKFKGKEVTIGDFPFENRTDVFYIKEDLEGYLWSCRMIEK